MKNMNMPVQFTPQHLYQSILPNWEVSLFNIDVGSSTNPEVEQKILNEVGSYGKQIGHLSDALEVVIKQLKLLDKDLSEQERDAIQIFLGDVAKVRSIKK